MKGRLFSALAALFVFVLAVGSTAAGVWLLARGAGGAWDSLSRERAEKRRALATSSVRLCGELTAVKNDYSGIVSVKKSRIAGLARSYAIVRYEAVLRAGVRDITDARVEVSDDGSSVRVVLPRCEVLENSITDIDIFDESQSVFVSVTTGDILSEVRRSRDETQAAQVEAGILREAESQSARVVTAVLTAAGFGRVEVEFE